jgi:hypothetical protein
MRQNSHVGFIRFLFFTIILAGAGYIGVRYYQDGQLPPPFTEAIAASKHAPVPSDPEVVRLADVATMTPYARDIFYRTVPQIDGDRGLFEAHCNLPNVPDSSVELACFAPSDNRIFILRIDDPALKSEMVVAAAHEMLHAAYRRMTTTERATIDKEIRAALPSVMNEALRATLRQYRISEPGQENNELHSILGTEYRNLTPALETYYAKFFANRLAVVAESEAWESVFSDLKAKIQRTEKQIRDLRAEMAEDRRRNNIAAYNAKVPRVNALVNQYNADVQQYNRLSRSLLGPELPDVPQ